MTVMDRIPGIRNIWNFFQRRRAAKIILAGDYFNESYYLEKYPDVEKAGIPPLEHFLRYGAFEGRNPSAKFNGRFYLAANPDVRSAGINPLFHFLKYGIHEQRAPLPPPAIPQHTGASSMDPSADVQTIHIDYTINVVYPNALQCRHFLPDGAKEGVNTHFDEVYVINLNYRDDMSQAIEDQLRRLNIYARIVEGINGYELPHLYEYEQYAKLPPGALGAPGDEIQLKQKAIPNPGAWGLLKTYRMILLDAMEKRHKRILVLEGDTGPCIEEKLFPVLLEAIERMNLPVDRVLRNVHIRSSWTG